MYEFNTLYDWYVSVGAGLAILSTSGTLAWLIGYCVWCFIDDKEVVIDGDTVGGGLIVVPFLIGILTLVISVLTKIVIMQPTISLAIGIAFVATFAARFTRRIAKQLNAHVNDKKAHSNG